MCEYPVVERAGTRVVDLTESPDDEWTVYIGRENAYYNLPESRFANPFTLDDFSRQAAVDLYKLWFYYRVETDEAFAAAARDLSGETLACYCIPDACHGEVILQWLDNEGFADGDLQFICARLSPRDIECVDDDVQHAIATVADWVGE